MDPNATFRVLADYLASPADHDEAEAAGAACALLDWLREGGFFPARVSRAETYKTIAEVLARAVAMPD